MCFLMVCSCVFVAEEKKHKLTELKTGLDEADSLVFVVVTFSLNSCFFSFAWIERAVV